MHVEAGTRLGPYEIVAPLGAGGMGEVWRARDTRLDRTVAVKILPASLAHNTQLRARFEREARSISQLNHPHICTLHDVGSEDGVDYLVMELLEGESLAQRLTRGALPLADVVRYGVQIAEALDRAHRGGIVHRDLKPGNIMITKAGAKLLDFGLARTAATPVSSPDTPTEHMPLTAEGTIVGTFQYMAPEQLAGDDADARTDIFALGAVLYEMTTGRRAFQGKNKTSLIASIVGGEPPRISDVQPLTPPALEHLIARCLAKDPDDRWQSAHDIAQELKWIGETGTTPQTTKRKSRERLFAISAALLLATTALLAWMLWRERSKPVPMKRAFLIAPPGVRFELPGHESSALTVSPDGNYVTFATGGTMEGELWLYSLATGESKRLANGHSPFWSPDSKSIAFFNRGKLQRIDVAGGPAVTITDSHDGRGGTWAADGTIVYEPHWRTALHRVPASGGKSTPVTALVASQQETTHRWPWFLPDGRHFLYLAGSHNTRADSDVNAIYIGSLDSPGRKLLLRARSNAIYASGHVLFVRENHLMAQPFDPDRRELTGDAVRIAQNVATVPGYFRALFGASAEGTLAYFTGPARGKRGLKWMDQAGNILQNVSSLDLDGYLLMSPDRKRVAVTVGDPSDIWVIDLERLTETRFTSEAVDETDAVWSPDGSRIAYSSTGDVLAAIYEKTVDGMSPPRRVLQIDKAYAETTDWSPDGKLLLANVEGRGGPPDVWVVPLDPARKPWPLIQSEFVEVNAHFSPDGRWVSYESDESGRTELYVMSFADRRLKKQLTGSGVLGHRWDGSYLEYGLPDGSLMRIRIDADRFGLPEKFGQMPEGVLAADFSADRKRLLVIAEEKFDPPAATLVSQWPRLVSAP